MAWTFNGTLLTSPFSRNWSALSGPHGNGHLPGGNYRIGRAHRWAQNEAAYTDPNGLCWFCPLVPDFGTSRTGLGIHPDGNVPGTEGCIGIQGIITETCLLDLQRSRGEILIVKY